MLAITREEVTVGPVSVYDDQPFVFTGFYLVYSLNVGRRFHLFHLLCD